MSRQFGIITSIEGTTCTGCVINSLSTSTSASKSEARNEEGKVTDEWFYSKEKSISVRGVLDASSLSIEAGQVITLRGGTFGVNSASTDETNTAAATFSLDASHSDNSTIHPYSADTAASGTNT